MTPKSEQRRATVTILAAAFLIVGAGVAVTGTTGTTTAPADAAIQETTTMEADQQTNVLIQNLSAPEQVPVGSNYTVSATIVNRGNDQVVNRVSYQIAGNAIAVKFVNVSGNDEETIQFNVTANDTAGFPTGTFTQGVYTEDANATANLTLVGETTPSETTTTPERTEIDETTETPTEVTETTPSEIITTTPETTTTPTETTPAETTTPAEAPTASIIFEDQDSNGSTVTIQSVTVPEGGFVVIHDSGVVEGEIVDSILGQSTYLEAGTHQNVTIELNQTLNQSQRVFAVVYRDSNDNQTFDFVESERTADGPYTKADSREAVNGIAVIEVNGETTNESA